MIPEVIQTPSPNFGHRRNGIRPELVVLHYTGMACFEAAHTRLRDPNAEVSAHFLISRRGQIFQLVDEDARAWHAGDGAWFGRGDVNSRSIGIELDNDGLTPFSEPLMASLEALLPVLLKKWNIPPSGVIGHADMAPVRKADPGSRFDWRRLAQSHLAIWPNASQSKIDFFQSVALLGYPVEQGRDVVLQAFRQRFRPSMSRDHAPVDTTDRGMAADLARQVSIDETL